MFQLDYTLKCFGIQLQYYLYEYNTKQVNTIQFQQVLNFRYA